MKYIYFFLATMIMTVHAFAQSGNALNFDGTGDYINLNSVPNLYNSDFTVETWVKLIDAPNSNRFIWCIGTSSADESAFIYINGAGQLKYGFYGQDYTAGTLSNDGQFYHVVFSYNKTTREGKLYLNGVNIDTKTFSTDWLPNPTNKIRIGSPSYRDDQNFQGILDELRIWNVVRTPSEIQTEMSNTNLNASTSGLLAYYHFDQGTGGGVNTGVTTLIDATSNDYDGTLSPGFALTGSTSNWVTNNDPLPVELTSFSASLVGNKVSLNWVTATEVNNFGFEIERKIVGTSRDLSEIWATISFIKGNGNSNSPKEYSFIDESVKDGKNSYRLKQIDFDGNFEYSEEIEVDIRTTPVEFNLAQNYPNPFNPSTVISYQLSAFSNVKLTVYDLLGNEVTVLVNKEQEAGVYNFEWNGSGLSSGVYYYRLNAVSPNGEQNFTSVKKMLLLK
jgi:hypothetical protein